MPMKLTIFGLLIMTINSLCIKFVKLSQVFHLCSDYVYVVFNCFFALFSLLLSLFFSDPSFDRCLYCMSLCIIYVYIMVLYCKLSLLLILTGP